MMRSHHGSDERRWTRQATVLLLFLGLLLPASIASAQRAPDGNAHPTNDVQERENLRNPMEAAQRSETVTDRVDKHAFAQDVNLEPLADLSIFANSRVAIVASVARTTVRQITGKSKYVDFVISTDDRGKTDVEKLSYDPLFTYFDMLADIEYYLDKPLVHVEFLSLREAILTEVFPGAENAEERERWMKLTRISPYMFLATQAYVAGELPADATWTTAKGKLNQAMNLFAGAYTQLHLIAPNSDAQRWLHISHDPRVAAKFTEFGIAWRARDARAVNTLAIEIADLVRAQSGDAYPPAWRANLESLYSGGKKFIIGYTLYFFAGLLLLIAFGTGRRTILRLGIAILISALALHAAGFAIRWILAERIPIQNQFESMLGLCLGACLFGTIAMFARKQTIFGVAAAFVGFLTLMTATMADIPGQEISREAAILNTSYILFYHVNIVLFSYGLIALGAVISAVYLASHYLKGPTTMQIAAAGVGLGDTPAEVASRNLGRDRLLNDLDHAQMVVLQLAFWILGVGILLGAWWADHSWGRWWAFDPKETWALITWIVYLIVIHVRLGVKNRGLVTAWLSIVGFIVMLWTYFGVNLLLPGLHAYA